jgi:RNA polymerase sigma-70 factor (ECF subfamily)
LGDSDISAAENISTGIEREVEMLYDSHAEAVLSYAQSIVLREDAARDAVQECFLRYFVERSCGRTILQPRAWLFRVAHNYLVERMKSAAARHETTSGRMPQVADTGHHAEQMLCRVELAAEVAGMLSPRELECLRFRLEGFSYEEIAANLEIRPGTVSALLARVHAKLRASVQGNRGVFAETIEALQLLCTRGEREPS